MRVNVHTLEEMLLHLECKFADLMYRKMKLHEYALKPCKSLINPLELAEFIDVLKRKIQLLKNKYEHFTDTSYTMYPSYIRKTSLQDFYDKEVTLNECDKKFLEKIQTLL